MLDALTPDFAPIGNVALAARRDIVSLAAFHGATASLGAALGVALPATPQTVAHDGITYLWSGPGSWLAMSEQPGLEAKLRAAASNLAAITDQSDGRVIFCVTNAEFLQKLVPVDLHETAFGHNATALTLAGQLTVQLWRAGADRFEIAGPRSFAGALYDTLKAADSPGRG